MEDTLVVFDFDNTLFRTKQFWREYVFTAFEGLEISHAIVEEAFVEATEKKADYFVEQFFIESLHTRTNVSVDTLSTFFWNILDHRDTRRWFFEGAVDLVTRTRAKYPSCILVTYGDQTFKEKFFVSCGISTYFSHEETIITTTPKVALVDTWKEFGRIVFINDVLTETMSVIERCTELGILIKAFVVTEESVPDDERYIHVRSLSDIRL